MYIYALTETGVGAGEDATEYVRFPRELTASDEGQLKAALADAKRRARDEGLDTGQMVDHALQVFGRWTGIHGEHVPDPVRKEIFF